MSERLTSSNFRGLPSDREVLDFRVTDAVEERRIRAANVSGYVALRLTASVALHPRALDPIRDSLYGRLPVIWQEDEHVLMGFSIDGWSEEHLAETVASQAARLLGAQVVSTRTRGILQSSNDPLLGL